MATKEKVAELEQDVLDLQSALDVKQEKIATKLAADKQTIADLQALLDAGNGATDDDIQRIIDAVQASRADLESTPTGE